jgi:hypothetical protein
MFADRSSAVISPCGTYRYALHRRWDDGPQCMFCMLNPSVADATKPDPTMKRCVNYAKSWGFAALTIGNLFAYRATDPDDMMGAAYPVGPDNNEWLIRLARESALILVAWGNHGSYRRRDAAVRRLLGGVDGIPPLHYLKLTHEGQPCHPLRLLASLKPIPWEDRPCL